MRYAKLLMIVFLLLIGIGAGAKTVVFADDDDDERYEYNYQGEYGKHSDGRDEEDGPYEEIGKMLGWGTAAAMGAAGVFFPIRRSMKWTIANLPSAKSFVISLTKFLGKIHVPLGIAALVISIVHGVTMFMSEGELEGEGFIGLASVIFMAIAAIFGATLMKNKKAKTVRTIHISLLGLALLIAIIHIFTA
ncbi:hypothetical protein [Bacillus benzoevorans]|uniref:Uncharacterized protein n=1 Tax=Bacillus benzoevorans TaxID=1456 RepID=A0A7X0LV16_9BACI|nr:hypothetical protein [Bacillus benzoevorans]MBB6445138.1 hypothetical protein [Bacillus benzoevorans]